MSLDAARRTGSRARGAASTAALALFVLVYSIPVIGVVLTSLKTNGEIARRGIWALTGDLTFENYVDVWQTANTLRYLINSFQVAIPAVAVSIAGGTMIGYALAKFRPRGGAVIQLVIVSGLFVPPQVLLVPLFTMFSDYGLLNTLWPMILVHSAVGFSITTLVMRNFFDQLPDSLRYAALIDGASEGQVFLKVMLPLARPALAALATLQFTFIWNDFLYPLVFTSGKDDVATIMLGLLNVKGQFTVAYGNQAAVAGILEREGMDAYTDNTITDPEILLADLEATAARGYALDNEELSVGVRCIASPVVDISGTVRASIGLSGPASRLDDERLQKCAALVCTAAKTLSEQLGGEWSFTAAEPGKVLSW